MKKIFVLMLLMVGFITPLSIRNNVQADGQTDVYLYSTSGLRVTPNVEFTTTITMNGSENISGFQLGFTYDESKFEVTNIEKNPNLPGNLTYNISNLGEIQVSYSDVEELLVGINDIFSVLFIPKDSLSFDAHELITEDMTYNQMVSWVDDANDIHPIDVINFQLSSVEKGVYGDVNGDGLVNIIDAGYIQQYMIGVRDFTNEVRTLADVNKDFRVDTIDVAYIQQYIVGIRNALYESPVNADPDFDYYITGNFADWDASFGVPNYEFSAISFDNPKLGELRYTLNDATLLYAIDIEIPSESAGWDVTYTINGEEQVFDGNLSLKMAKTEDVEGEAVPVWWGPSPESGEIKNLTPNTLFMPNWVDPASDDYVEGEGDWNSNPTVFQPGSYTIVYAVVDGAKWMGAILNEVNIIYPDQATYPSGLYDYRYQTSEVRHTFMAAAEKYLLETMAGGVPIFSNGRFSLYSSRLQLPVEDYMPVLGYGEKFGTMTTDDSNVLMADGETGNEGEYTYRTTSTTNPVTWNQWIYDTSTDADYMELYMDAPYRYQFNADKTGYELLPSMMADVPHAVGSRITSTGKEVSKTWQMTVRDDLEWYYHPDTITMNISDDVINAVDFVETYKLALRNNWFRAVSGGSDFITSYMSIEGAAEFNADPTEANWANVGINLIDDYTFEFVFIDEQSEWDVKYFMSDFVKTPINIELYEELSDVDDGGSYGTNNTTIAYSGPFYVDYYEADKTLVYKENTNYHNQDEYFYTGYEFAIIDDAAVRFQEFVTGKLETVTLPTEEYDNYKNHPGLRRIPGATTFRMMINGLGTVEDQQEQFPGSTYVPEPLLAVEDFKRAMYFAIDTNRLATEVLKTSQPQMYLFTDAYLVEPEEGVPYRQTEPGLTVGEGLSPGTNGYNIDAAVAYWQLALDALVADGTYSDDDVIELDFYIFSGSEAQTLLGTYIKDTFETTFAADSNEYGISIEVTVTPRDFPGIYYDYMMTGNFDLSIGGISGSTLDAASFLDVFCDDNRGGFTLNWGIDTSMADIPVKYVTYDYDQEGNIIRVNYNYEMWSFNAITSILNDQKYIIEGEEANAPSPSFEEILPTEFTFRIDEFSNTAYTNITYSIYEWQQDIGQYTLFDELENVSAETELITITGTKPYPYDYEIVINYELTSGENVDVPFETSTWEYSAQIGATTFVTETTAEITLDLDDNAAREFLAESVVVYLNADDTEITAATVVIDRNVVTISGLTAGTEYYIMFDTNEGFDIYVQDYEYVVFTTD